MRTSPLRWLRLALAPALILTLAVAVAPSPATAQPPESGIVCTSGAAGNPLFTLTARSGYVAMPDGNTIFSWGYALGGGTFQLPGPTLCVNQGDTVTVVLNNTLPEATSIIFPALEGVRVNGAPAQPVFDSGGNLTSLTNTAGATNGSVTYSFTAASPGTFLYESGTDPGKQVQMGLYGALVVRPAINGGGHVYAYGTGSEYSPAHEFVLVLSEIDPALHQAVERRTPYDITKLHPRYWLINGRAFPDTIAPNNAAWLPSQPYSALVHQTVNDNASNPLPILLRYLNAGSRNHPFHPHGQNGRVVGRDGQPLIGPNGEDLSYETFSFTIGSGQSWDATYAYYNQEQFDPSSNQVPVTIPQLQNLTFKGGATWYGGSPYLGYQDDLPQGTTTYNQCGEYYMVFHSHALNEVANYDASFGGMLTLQRIDPPTATQQQTGHLCQ